METTGVLRTTSSAVPAVDEEGDASLFREIKPPLTDTGAVVEANRCLECGGPYAEAPCIEACPTGIDIPEFVSAIADGDREQAAETIYAENVLGASCAKVCPVETLCEEACVLEDEGRKPVEIGRLQRYAAEGELTNGFSLQRNDGQVDKSVAVVGAGPAGLACAARLVQRGYDVTVYDENEDFGGLVRYAVAPYRIQRDPLPREVEMIADLGVEFEMAEPIDSPDKLQAIEDEADAVFLGVGLGEDVDIGYPGEDLPGVWESMDFIRAIKTGQEVEVGDTVAVIGGGNTAIDVAVESKTLGARDVTVFYRRTEPQMPAYDHEVELAREEGVHFQFLTNPLSFSGENRLQSMECRYMKLGEPDASGRPRPIAVPDTEFTVQVDTVIKAIGQRKREAFLGWIDNLQLDDGLIEIDPETKQTANPKYFAGGDAINGGATVVEAVQDGKRAAAGIDHFLRGEQQ